MSTAIQQASARFRQSLDRSYAPNRYTTQARVTAVTKDSTGRVTSVTCTIDGAAGQKVQVPFGAALGVDSVIGVTNVGTASAPVYQYGTTYQGTAAGAVMLLTGPDGQPYVTPGGVLSPKANLLRNGDFTLAHKAHLNQPHGWVLSGQARLVDGIPGDE